MNHILVLGAASLDTLHLKDRSVTTVGGAGMYTAMAARRCGAQVAIFADWPDTCPVLMQPVVSRLTEALGPSSSVDMIPKFEISYRSGNTEYLDFYFGGEAALAPAMLADDLSEYDLVHVIPLGSVEKQMAFIRACRERGVRLVSGGTFPVFAREQAESTRDIIESCDIFFMNGREARAIFGSLEAARVAPGKLLFVTLGREGACIVQGETQTYIPAKTAIELDPTGAGDTFCGATLAFLVQGEHPIMAARKAAALAAEMIGAVGMSALMVEDPPPLPAADGRVSVNSGQVRRVAEKISTLPDLNSFSFTGPGYPSIGFPGVLDYFFAATLQQFGFWSMRSERYHHPLLDTIGGQERKGSDYLWFAFARRLEQDSAFCTPQRQAYLDREDLLDLFRADDGHNPMPALDLHLKQANAYGRDMLALGLTPRAIVQEALASPEPLKTFLQTLDHIGGYKEDPLRKKSALLAMILNRRPEFFLPLGNGEAIPPIIDYHHLRANLRMGLVDVMDNSLAEKLAGRRIVSREEEWAVRYPAYQAIAQLIPLSGRRSDIVDAFFFAARRRCPEMSEPSCGACEVNDVCGRRSELFQPVLRTSFY